MQSEITTEPIKLQRKKISFPFGLPAFEDVREFVLIANEDEAPFIWLQAISTTTLAFITVDPFIVCKDYLPDIPDEDARSLGIETPDDAFILSIVNMKNQENTGITANLVSPIVINWRNLQGKQVIIRNYQDYSVRHLIRTDEEEEQE